MSTPSRSVEIPANGVRLPGDLVVPPGARGIVVFAHGSGGGRFSPRNRAVAATLQAAGLGTLLLDLLTEAEAADRANVFDIDLLAERVERAIEWLRSEPATQGLRIGLFGASTGAAAALRAAAARPADVAAVVSRGGRPDLAEEVLPRVAAPTLLIVGGRDTLVLDLNRQAYARLTVPRELRVIPGAGHLFEEPGALEQVAEAARDWFLRYLR